MSYTGLHAAVDFDSCCYAAGMANDIKEMEIELHKYVKKIHEVLQPSKVVGFVEAIDDKFIWRNFVAITKGYKSNRRDRIEPPFRDSAKILARSKYGFSHCRFYESEDAVSIYAHDNGVWATVKCGVDGDLLTCPGIFYNYFGTKWKLPYYTEIDEYVITVDGEQAQRNFYYQMCTGDSQDAIRGVSGVGPVAAQSLVDGCGVDELPYAVAGLYKSKGYGYHYFCEMAMLLKIQERRDELCRPLTEKEYYDGQA